MVDFVASVGKLRVVRFKNGYSVTFNENVVSNRQLANYVKVPKLYLQRKASNYKAKLHLEDTREISYFEELTDAVCFVKEILHENG